MKKSFWLKLHAYVAIFFLPFMLLYASTGAGYLLGLGQFAGSTKQTYELNIAPIDKKDEMKRALLNALSERNLFIPGESERMRDSKFSLNNAKYFATIFNKDGKMYLEYIERSWFGALYNMHFGHGGKIFTTLSVAFAVFLLVVYLSGVIAASWCVRYRKSAVATLILSIAIVLFCYFWAGSI